MDEVSSEHLPKSPSLTKKNLTSLRDRWSGPDSRKGWTWEFDGVFFEPGHWMSYEHEMQEGLDSFGCKTFDDLVNVLEKKLGRKPNVVDLMGGAYFLRKPENANSLVGIRIHDKDEDHLDAAKKRSGSEHSLLTQRIIGASNRKVIEADVLSSAGWKEIEKAGIQKVDLLVCRPVGPFEYTKAMGSRFDNPEAYAGLYSSLFNRMLNLINRNGGVVFTEVPDIYTDDQVKEFFGQIDEKEGSRTKLFEVANESYHQDNRKRRYAVVQFESKS